MYKVLLKALTLASYLAVGDAFSASFQYSVECDHRVVNQASYYKSVTTWDSSKSSKSNYEKLERSGSAGGKYGLIRANVAFAMSNVNHAATSSETASSFHSEELYQSVPGTLQVFRTCVHTVHIAGQKLKQTVETQVQTENLDNRHSAEYWKGFTRTYMNENIIPGLPGVALLCSTCGTKIWFNENVLLHDDDGWNVQTTLLVENGYWGTWGTTQMCPRDHYAVAVRIRQEAQNSGRRNKRPSRDESATNGFQMECQHVAGMRNGRAILGAKGNYYQDWGKYGDWLGFSTCTSGSFAAAFKVRMEARHSGDNAAMNGMAMACRWSVHPNSGGRYYHGNTIDAQWSSHGYGHQTIHAGWWGNWGAWATCPDRMYMCGYQWKFDENSDNYDESGANGMKIICCRMPWDNQ